MAPLQQKRNSYKIAKLQFIASPKRKPPEAGRFRGFCLGNAQGLLARVPKFTAVSP